MIPGVDYGRVCEFIGTPWEKGASGPNSFDCWHFFRFAQRELFGIDLSPVDGYGKSDVRSERKSWQPVEIPSEGDAVLVHHPLHIGLWLDYAGGGILHCVQGQGVIWTRERAWRVDGFGERKYYRHRSRQ